MHSISETSLRKTARDTPDPSVVKTLIEAGADPNARDGVDMTPFDCAKDNEALQGTEVYRRLGEARFKQGLLRAARRSRRLPIPKRGMRGYNPEAKLTGL